MSDRKQGYILYRTWTPLIMGLPDAEAGILFKAICTYQDGKEVHIENPMLNAIFQMIQSTFTVDEERYAERCRINAENGAKGGRPPKNPSEPNKTDGFTEEPKKADIDKEMENEIDKGLGMGMGTGLEMDNRKGVQGENPKEEPCCYGNHNNVYLTQSELDKLIDTFGTQQTQYAIDTFSYSLSKVKSPSTNDHFQKLYNYLHAETSKG